MFWCLVGRVVVTGSVGSSPDKEDASSTGEAGPVCNVWNVTLQPTKRSDDENICQY